MELLGIVCRLLLLVVFATSAMSKARPRAFRVFRTELDAARLLPARWTSPAAVGVVMAEGVVVPLLALPATARAGAGLAALLLTLFTLVIVLSMRRRSGLVCRCFGAGGVPLGRRHLARNAGLLVACLAAVPMAAHPAPQSFEALAFGVALAGAVAIFVIRLDDILDVLGLDGRS